MRIGRPKRKRAREGGGDPAAVGGVGAAKQAAQTTPAARATWGLRHLPATASCAAAALVPLGIPHGVEAHEVALVVGAALTGAYWPDATADEGPGPLLRIFFGTAGEALRNASSGAGAPAARKTHALSAAVLFSALSAVLFLAGAAGIAAWAAASGAYLAHLAQDKGAGRHGVCLVPGGATTGRRTEAEPELKPGPGAKAKTRPAARTAPTVPARTAGVEAALTRLIGGPPKRKKAGGARKKAKKTGNGKAGPSAGERA